MVNKGDVGAGGAQPEGHPQRVEDEVGAHVGGELPADDLAGEDVDHEGEEDHPSPGAQVGEVDYPKRIGALCREVAADQVGAALALGIGRCRAPGPPSPLGALDAVLTHQALDRAVGDRLAAAQQLLPGAPRAVGLVVAGVDELDLSEQALVLDPAGRAAPSSPLVVGGGRHLEDAADRLDPEAVAMFVDEHAHLGRGGSSSLAKKTEAALRISLARRSSLTSRSSAFSRSRSPVVSRSARWPSSASAWRTQRRRDSRWMPRSLATWAIGRLDSSARRTPRSLNSSGYFLGAGIRGGSPHRRTERPPFEVSVKAGMAHICRGQLSGRRLQVLPAPVEWVRYPWFRVVSGGFGSRNRVRDPMEICPPSGSWPFSLPRLFSGPPWRSRGRGVLGYLPSSGWRKPGRRSSTIPRKTPSTSTPRCGSNGSSRRSRSPGRRFRGTGCRRGLGGSRRPSRRRPLRPGRAPSRCADRR